MKHCLRHHQIPKKKKGWKPNPKASSFVPKTGNFPTLAEAKEIKQSKKENHTEKELEPDDDEQDNDKKKEIAHITLHHANRTMKLKIRSGSSFEDITKAVQNRFQLQSFQKFKVVNESNQSEYTLNDQISSGTYRILLL